MRVGLLPLGRATFDVPFAEARLSAMLAALDAAGAETVGPRRLLLDGEAAEAAIREVAAAGPDLALVLQVTFTDAGAVARAAETLAMPLALWSVPEPRSGGRLRLNALCGLNLAAHALGRRGRAFAWLHAAPETAGPELAGLLAGGRQALPPPRAGAAPHAGPEGARLAAALRGRRIGRVGAHPPGFDTCAYDAERLRALAGVEVAEYPLAALFDRARAVPAAAVAGSRAELDGLGGIAALDRDQLDRSLRLLHGLRGLRAEDGLDAFALRCWPETFTEYGGAVCGPAGLMGGERVPCACEADMYGAVTALLLQEAAGAPAFLADLVDVDEADGTAVVWHCGQAPLAMRDPGVPPRATIHSNRRMPLLLEFPLRPGRVTLARLSQARGEPCLVLAGAEMLARPMAFTGTSGVLRPESGAGPFLARLIGGGIEHHLALAYGEHRPALRAAAAALGLPLMEL